MPFCGPVKDRPAVKNSAAVAFFLLARITMNSVTATNSSEDTDVGDGIADRPAFGGKDVECVMLRRPPSSSRMASARGSSSRLANRT